MGRSKDPKKGDPTPAKTQADRIRAAIALSKKRKIPVDEAARQLRDLAAGWSKPTEVSVDPAVIPRGGAKKMAAALRTPPVNTGAKTRATPPKKAAAKKAPAKETPTPVEPAAARPTPPAAEPVESDRRREPLTEHDYHRKLPIAPLPACVRH